MDLHPALLRDADEALGLLLRSRMTQDRWARAEADLAEMEAALRAGDPDRLRTLVHRLDPGDQTRAAVRLGDDAVTPPGPLRELVNRLVLEIRAERERGTPPFEDTPRP